MLKGLCLDTERSGILQRMERSLDVLGGTVERISNTAEVLGAVHQEARVSRAVKLMVAHEENLKMQHHRNVAELQEVKKRVQQQNSSKTVSHPRAAPDPEESDSRKKNSHQNSGVRYRVSTTLIPSQIQKKLKRDKKKPAPPGRDSFLPCSSPPRLNSESSCSAMSKDDRLPVDGRLLDPEETLSDTPAVEFFQPPPPAASASH
ncbi:inositol 1,4,5-triphosphate receptor associated 2 [Pseudoliparis swirei]|uniref:inositol 1,4,5-triphosphate receptor associated 2 n=1 Tax=Pseudoliparis swirei TaxID=2059687 RepID=UPI0024BE82F4|nr:inositol 1,4,5-triphosphate receptor associated 2 [Pseudoliparis swirei]